MGLLSEGSPLDWEETKKYADHVRKHGIAQFINLYHKLKDRSNDVLRWGDEVEYMLVKFSHEEEKARVVLKAGDILGDLQHEEKTSPGTNETAWRPEYAAFHVEGTPGQPYGHRMAHFNMVEANMKLRREEVKKLLSKDETVITLTSFPRSGCEDFTVPPTKASPLDGASRSLFFPDEAIFQGHPRFTTLTRNIRQRRGEKVIINIPVFKDTETKEPFTEDFSVLGDDGEAARASKPNHVYLDCMGFGMGCACLQMTFQACHINEARHLYDQLAPLCPILLALSAGTPIQRGLLTDIDCRWNIIAASVDCRTRQERGEEPLTDARFRINKSRYDSIDSYLSPCSEQYNDIDLIYDEELYQQMISSGIDNLLAQHMAHLFIRDPISLFSEKIHQTNDCDTDHFENIQSTNWQTMRFKPPPPCSPIGWRVEFRPTEVQLTDFENAAFVVFVVLLTRVILSFKLNFVIPISKVDENMNAAQKRDAVIKEKFYFRKEPMCTKEECHLPGEEKPSTTRRKRVESNCECGRTSSVCEPNDQPELEYEQMSIDTIINGQDGGFPGLIPLIKQYLEMVDDIDVDTHCTITQYLKLISKRASGELKTAAKWIRDYVTSHPDYKHDSVVSDKINYDLLMRCEKIVNKEVSCDDFLPSHLTKSSGSIPSAMEKADTYFDEKRPKRENSVNGVKE